MMLSQSRSYPGIQTCSNLDRYSAKICTNIILRRQYETFDRYLSRNHSRSFENVLTRALLPDMDVMEPSRNSSEEFRGQALMSEPLSMLDVDLDLWGVLDLCSDEELELLYKTLHSTSLFSPVVKSLVTEREPALLELRGRVSVMHKLESRFRFLAADSQSLLQGRRPGYRETLLSIRDR